MRKRNVILGMLALLIGACTTKYEKNDIRDYVREQYGIRSFQVSSTPKEMHNPDDEYTDYLWTITEDNGRVFHILDDYHWGMEALVNQLICDREQVMLKEFCEGRKMNRLQLEASENEGLTRAVLAGEYASRSELHALHDELVSLLKEAGGEIRISYHFDCIHPYRTIGEYTAQEADLYGNARNETDADLSEGERNYLYLCLDHRYEGMNEFSEAEIEEALKDYSYRVWIRTDESGPHHPAGNLAASRYGYGISFAGLYELLKMDGYDVQGDAHHYSFTAKDGSSYEFSYDFRENEAYYYLKDGEKVPMDYYFYNHFVPGRLQSMFGLDVMLQYEVQK